MKKLVCKACGFQAPNLEPHISKDHAAEGGIEWYVAKFNCDETDIIHPDLISKPAPAAPSKTKDGSVKIRDSEIVAINSTSQYVPPVNAAYLFPEVANDVVADIDAGKKVMLIGHTGTGKTSLIDQIGARAEQGVLRVNMNGQTTIGDFIGLWTVKGGETVWVDGVLPKAMRDGLWLTVDEIDFAEPAILAALNSVLEVNGKLTLKEKGHEVVEPHTNFRLFATANGVGCMSDFRGLYQGTNLMNEAFLDRWRVYHIDYLPADEEAKVVAASVPKMNIEIATYLVRVANMVRDAFKKEEISCTFSLRRMLDWAELMVRHRDPIKAAGPAIFSKVSRQDAEVIRGIIQRVIGTAAEK